MLHSFPRSILARTALAAITGIGIVAALSACTSAPQAEEELGSISTMADIDAWRIDYDDCMLKAGFDLSAGIPMQSTEAGESAPTFGDKSPEDYQKADASCIKEVGEPPTPPGMPTAEETDAMMLEFARCMREAGYDYPDPQPVSGGASMSVQAYSADEINPDDVDACSTQSGLSDAFSSEPQASE